MSVFDKMASKVQELITPHQYDQRTVEAAVAFVLHCKRMGIPDSHPNSSLSDSLTDLAEAMRHALSNPATPIPAAEITKAALAELTDDEVTDAICEGVRNGLREGLKPLREAIAAVLAKKESNRGTPQQQD